MIVDISRMPVIDISRVRGIGVALIEHTSTEVRSRFICSLCSTPKRCSSSTTIRPRSFIRISGLSSRCVPTTMFDAPIGQTGRDLGSLLGGLETPLKPFTTTGSPLIRSANVERCWVTSSVVGTSTAHVLAVLHRLSKAARTAISVLP